MTYTFAYTQVSFAGTAGLEISTHFKEDFEGAGWMRGSFILPWDELIKRVKENSHAVEG